MAHRSANFGVSKMLFAERGMTASARGGIRFEKGAVMRRILLTATACLFLAATAFGQTFNAQIGGIVQDPSRALIPGATITLTNTGTGVIATQITNESGAYQFANIQPGTYRATATLPGFKTSVISDVGVGTAAQVRLDFTLEVGEISSQLEVSVSAQQLLTQSSATIGEVLPADRAVNLPITNQDVLELVRIMPGMRVDPFGDAFSTFTGLPTNTINTVRDGLSVTDTRNNSGIFGTTTINPDLVGEIRIILSPVDAEVGRGNGQIQIQTRSGTNRYTGSAVWNIRNTSVNASTWLNNQTVNPLTGAWEPTRSDWRNAHQYTLSYGGPIRRNKTFFFALWDQNITRTRTLVSTNVLTDTARQGIFRYFTGWNSGHALTPVPTFPASATAGVFPVIDFAGNPRTPSSNPNGTPYTGELICFSVFGNVKANGSPFGPADCPGGRAVTSPAPWDRQRAVLDPTGYISKLINAMPRANFFAPAPGTTLDGLNLGVFRWLRGRSGNTGGAAQNGTSPESVNRKQINIKIDENINTNHRVNVGWTYELDDNADNVANWPGGFNGESRRRPHILTVNYNSTLTPSVVNEARFGVSLNNSRVDPPWYSTDSEVRKGAEEFLLKGGTVNGFTYPIAVTPGNGAFSFGNGLVNQGSTYSGFDSYLYNYADTLSWARGAHAFRMGAEVRLVRSSGYSGGVFPTATGGAGDNTSPLANAIAALPNELATTRTNAANMLYFLAGSVNSASMLYWISSDDDFKNGTWQNLATNPQRQRKQIANEYAFFYKDDWKVNRRLTLNLGIRYEYYGSPYIEGGFTAAVADLGYGLFGPSRIQNPFDAWLQPGNLYLSGYGPNATNPLRCTSGTANPNGLPSSSCDPSKLTQIEFVGPSTDNRKKTAIPNDRNNFGPAIGFSWQMPWFGEGKTTIRGGFQVTYGLAGRNAGTLDNLLGNLPGNSSTANLVRSDYPQLQNANRALQLGDLPLLVPVRPTSPAVPGGQVEIYNRSSAFTAYDPQFATPYTENYTLSATRQINQDLTLEVKYIGVMGRKRQGSYNINLPNIYYNKELLDALEMTRRGEDAPLFDQMFAGLDLHGTTGTGYGPIGTTVNGVLQRGSAHLRRNATYSGNIADGNYVAIANSLNTLSAATVTSGPGSLQAVPGNLPGVGGRVLRNGCDRIAAGLYNPAQPASATNIPTRCFPENYIVMNPQLGTATYNANLAGSHYNSMQATLSARVLQTSFQTTYTFSTTMGYMPANWNDPLNRNADKAPPYQAVRHDLRTNGTFPLPIGPNKLLFPNSTGWVARAIEGWQTSIILNASSGNPRTIIGAAGMLYATGNQNLDAGQRRADVVSPKFDPKMRGHVEWNGPGNNTGLYYGNNWVQVEDPQCQLVNRTDSMGFNLYTNGNCGLNAIALRNQDGSVGELVLRNPTPGRMGNAPFTLEAPGKWKFDANLSKSFRISESKSLQVRIDAENVLNHADVADPQPQTGQSINTDGIIFGQIPSKGGNGSGASPRSFQAQVRITF
jgi:hypothetical protein